MAQAGEVPGTKQDFKLVVPISADPGADVILPVHLSPETSAVSMTIRWLRGTELLYHYLNGEEITGEGCVNLSIQQLERGNLSLTLRNVQASDSGDYTYKVIHDGRMQTGTFHLQVREEGQIKELQTQRKELEQDMVTQINELERQIQKLEKQKKELEKQIKELETGTTRTLHGSTPRRRNSILGTPPRMERDDQNTRQTSEENTVTEQETPGTFLQRAASTSESLISPARAKEAEENPGATMQMDQERRQEISSTDIQSQLPEDTTQTPERPGDRT